MTVIVVLGLVVVVIVVVVLVALGMRASRQARDEEEEWMSEEQPQPQPPARGHRGGRGGRAGRGGHAGHADEEPGDGYGTGYDRRVAGAPLGAPTPSIPREPAGGPMGPPGGPMGQSGGLLDSEQDPGQGFGKSGPAKGRDRSTPQPLASRRGRTSEEMEDDDYWATITFDKPKFPWQHDNGQRPKGEDPLAAARYEEEHAAPFKPLTSTGPEPAFGQDVHAGGPSTGDNLLGGSRPLTGPYDLPVSAGAGGGRNGSIPDPLGLPEPFGAPVARADSRDRDLPGMDSPFTGEHALPSTPAHSSTMSTQNFSLDSLGSPLSRPAASVPPPPAVPVVPAASASGPRTGSGSGSSGQDTDGHRLPTVDELLQRIQSDRRRTSEAAADSSPSSSLYGGSDPLNDPLSSSGSSWSSSGTSSSYDSDPLGTSGSRSNGLPGSSYSGGYDSGSGYRSSSSSGYSTDGYPSAPAYGSAGPTRYDDPLAGSGYGGSSGAGRDPYGSLGGTSDPGSDTGEQPGRYAEFSGGYGGSAGTDPLGGPRGYPESPSSGSFSGYGSVSPGHGQGGYPSEPSYGAGAPRPKDYTEPDYGSAPYGSDRQRPSNTPGTQGTPGTPDDWDTYRDFRR